MHARFRWVHSGAELINRLHSHGWMRGALRMWLGSSCVTLPALVQLRSGIALSRTKREVEKHVRTVLEIYYEALCIVISAF